MCTVSNLFNHPLNYLKRASNSSTYPKVTAPKLLFGAVISLFLNFPAVALTIGVMYDNAGDRYNYLEIERNFNQLYPSISVEFIGLTSVKYKLSVSEWLTHASGPDIIFWHAGERLMQFVRQGYVENVDELSEQDAWPQKFSAAMLHMVSYQDSVYAVPVSFFQWGIFYNKSVLNQFDIAPPRRWQEFVEACRILKKNGLEPIAIGSVEPWVLAAWFDYINLRLNGLTFHQGLLNGEIPFTDARVIKVFEYWAELINGNYFLSDHQLLKWDSGMPYLFRDLSAFTLIGNFFSSRIPLNIQAKIGFMPFPEIVPENNGFEEAPMDIFFIRASSKNKEDAKKFLSYLSRADAQTKYNQLNGGFPPNNRSQVSDNVFNPAGLSLLRNAKGLSQYFDRDSIEGFSTPALQIFAEFMQSSNINMTVKKLEELRQSQLLPSHP